MRKTLALVLTLVLALSLCACGQKTAAEPEATPAPVVMDGNEISIKDYLIEQLSAYIHSDEYLKREEAFEETFQKEAQPFAVTYAFELKMDGYGNENLSLDFFMIKANCNYFVDGCGFDEISLLVDYDTGMVYDSVSVDESWMEKGNKEEAIYVAVAGGCFVDSRYNGEPIFVESETHIPLSESDIVQINEALSK